MYFAKTLLVCASLVASAVSQSRIAFTVLPSSIQAGKDVTLHWGGGDGSPVTLTLQQGTTADLKTVLLVAGDVTGDSYTWSVPKSLPDGTDYALRIQQGDTEPNYTGMIAVTGGSTSSGSTSTTSSASSSASVSASSKSASVAAATVASHNSTATATANSTTTAPIGTAAKSSGTGTSIARNTTMSIATLSSSSSSATTSNPSVGGSGGSPTGSTSAPAPSKTGGAIALVASNFALLMCAVAGIVFLG